MLWKWETNQQLCAYYRKSNKLWVCVECLENLTQMQFSTRCSLRLHSINIQVTLKQAWLIQAIIWIKIEWLQTQDFLNPATNKAIVIYRGTYLRDFNIITLQECKCAISTSSRELHKTRNNILSYSHDPKVQGTTVINVILCPQVHDLSVRVLFIR